PDLPDQRAPPAAPAHAGGAAEANRAHGVRRPHHLLPDRRAARTRPAVADRQGKVTAVAVPALAQRRRPMTLRAWSIALLAVLVIAGPALAPAPVVAQGKDVFIPLLVYRTGPFAPSGIPIANGFVDYFTLVNERDGGINGVKISWEECETQYDTKQGVECYERLKSKNPVLVNPYSTGITYQLIPKAPIDKIVVFSMGYGMSAASDGRWFPYVFSAPTNYWTQ